MKSFSKIILLSFLLLCPNLKANNYRQELIGAGYGIGIGCITKLIAFSGKKGNLSPNVSLATAILMGLALMAKNKNQEKLTQFIAAGITHALLTLNEHYKIINLRSSDPDNPIVHENSK